jgi:hypothetical protein
MRVPSGSPPAAASTVKPPDEKPNAPTRSGAIAAVVARGLQHVVDQDRQLPGRLAMSVARLWSA